jgi:hypothetical protein
VIRRLFWPMIGDMHLGYVADLISFVSDMFAEVRIQELQR